MQGQVYDLSKNLLATVVELSIERLYNNHYEIKGIWQGTALFSDTKDQWEPFVLIAEDIKYQGWFQFFGTENPSFRMEALRLFR